MANFDKIVKDILEAEGVKFNVGRTALNLAATNPSGYNNLVTDPGGETNFGLSKRANADLDIKNLTLEQAIARYRERYWDPHNLGLLADAWAHFLFDSYVQHNPAPVAAWQKQYAKLSDAMWGRMRYYAALDGFNNFGRGWVRRMANLRDLLVRDYGVYI